MATDVRRREFISVLGGAVVWPFAARAQPTDKIRRIGLLPAGYLPTDPEGQARVAAFLDTLSKLGWSDGRNVRVEVRWSSNELERISAETTALAGSAPAAIVISSNAALAMLQKLNKTVSTVFVQVSDPVGSGFVRSLSRPDGNDRLSEFRAGDGRQVAGAAQGGRARCRAGNTVIVHPDTAAHFEFLRAAETPSLLATAYEVIE